VSEPVKDVTPFGPITNPVDRFAHLPEPTRKWLESLREDDLKDIIESVQLYHRARIIARFGKWTLATILATFIAGVAIGEGIQKILGWIVRGARP
jgi:hypothetical protein